LVRAALLCARVGTRPAAARPSAYRPRRALAPVAAGVPPGPRTL